MKLLKAILRQTVDLLFLAATLIFLIMFLCNKWEDAGFWLAACVIYVAGNTWSKAHLSIWLEDNNLVKK